MSSPEIAYHYAKALFHLPTSQETLSTALAEVTLLLKEVPKLGPFLLNPQISKPSKKKLLQKMVSEPLLINFLLLLLDKGRIKYLPEIAGKYQRLIAEYRKIIDATLITATVVDDRVVSRLKGRLESTLKRPVLLHKKIEREILGGMILMVGNQILDFSLRWRLNRLEKTLLKTGLRCR